MKHYHDNEKKLFVSIMDNIRVLDPEIENTMALPEIVAHVNFRLSWDLPYEPDALKFVGKRVAEEIVLVYNDYYLEWNIGKPAFLVMVSNIIVL